MDIEFLDGVVSLLDEQTQTNQHANNINVYVWKEITRKSNNEILLNFTYLDRSQWFGQLIQWYLLRSIGSLRSLHVNISYLGGSKSYCIGFMSNWQSVCVLVKVLQRLSRMIFLLQINNLQNLKIHTISYWTKCRWASPGQWRRRARGGAQPWENVI